MKSYHLKSVNGKRKVFGIRAGRLLKGLGMLCLVLALSGCATLKEKFTPKTQANVSIFADTTISILSQADLGFEKNEAIYVREFFDYEAEEEQRLFKNIAEGRRFFRGIVKYSLELVVITETHDTAADQIKAYADYISNFDDIFINKLGLEKDYYAKVIEEVRAQKEFMDALKKAQPIIYGASRYTYTVLDEMNNNIEALARKLERRIDERYADVIRYQKELETEKYAVLKAVGQLYRTFKGDPDAFDRLIESKAILKKDLIPKGSPSYEDLSTIADYLATRLQRMHLVGTEIQPDWEDYRATHRELDRLQTQAIERVNRARLVNLVWLRAHQKMAAGVQSPAEWFNINDLPATMFQMGTKALF